MQVRQQRSYVWRVVSSPTASVTLSSFVCSFFPFCIVQQQNIDIRIPSMSLKMSAGEREVSKYSCCVISTQLFYSLHTHVLICGHRHRVACLQTSTSARCVLKRMSLFLVTRFESKKQKVEIFVITVILSIHNFFVNEPNSECASFCFVVLFERYCLIAFKHWEHLGME